MVPRNNCNIGYVFILKSKVEPLKRPYYKAAAAVRHPRHLQEEKKKEKMPTNIIIYAFCLCSMDNPTTTTPKNHILYNILLDFLPSSPTYCLIPIPPYWIPTIPYYVNYIHCQFIIKVLYYRLLPVCNVWYFLLFFLWGLGNVFCVFFCVSYAGHDLYVVASG